VRLHPHVSFSSDFSHRRLIAFYPSGLRSYSSCAGSL
jgi:hypothetical protein